MENVGTHFSLDYAAPSQTEDSSGVSQSFLVGEVGLKESLIVAGGGGSIVERGMRAMGHGGRLNRLSRLCAESKAVRPCVALN